jgi:hypothetical protein
MNSLQKQQIYRIKLKINFKCLINNIYINNPLSFSIEKHLTINDDLENSHTKFGLAKIIIDYWL